MEIQLLLAVLTGIGKYLAAFFVAAVALIVMYSAAWFLFIVSRYLVQIYDSFPKRTFLQKTWLFLLPIPVFLTYFVLFNFLQVGYDFIIALDAGKNVVLKLTESNINISLISALICTFLNLTMTIGLLVLNNKKNRKSGHDQNNTGSGGDTKKDEKRSTMKMLFERVDFIIESIFGFLIPDFEEARSYGRKIVISSSSILIGLFFIVFGNVIKGGIAMIVIGILMLPKMFWIRLFLPFFCLIGAERLTDFMIRQAQKLKPYEK